MLFRSAQMPRRPGEALFSGDHPKIAQMMIIQKRHAANIGVSKKLTIFFVFSIHASPSRHAIGFGVMKNSSSKWNVSQAAKPALWQPNTGFCVVGNEGRLRIALDSVSLTNAKTETAPTHWLLPLNSIDAVRLSEHLPGEVLWASPLPPRNLAGDLAGDFRGAWWDGVEARLRLNDEVEAYSFPSRSAEIGFAKALANIVARRWEGMSPLQVQEELIFSEPKQNRQLAFA